MASNRANDKFSNIAFLRCQESAVDTLTFAQLAMANNLSDQKAALIINRAEMTFTNLGSLNSNGDMVDAALCLSDRVTPLYDLSQPEILFYFRVQRWDMGAAASAALYEYPLIRDFTELPGGGLLVPADRLYLGIKSTGAASVDAAELRIYYTVMQLKTEDYWELVEARRVMTT